MDTYETRVSPGAMHELREFAAREGKNWRTVLLERYWSLKIDPPGSYYLGALGELMSDAWLRGFVFPEDGGPEALTAADARRAARRKAKLALGLPPVKRRASARVQRPSILDQVRLSDGRLAWPVAKAAGMNEATFRARLKKRSPDEAVSMPVIRGAEGFRRATYQERGASGPAYYEVEMSSGEKAWPVAQANGVSRAAFCKRLARGWSVERAVRPASERSEGVETKSAAETAGRE